MCLLLLFVTKIMKKGFRYLFPFGKYGQEFT